MNQKIKLYVVLGFIGILLLIGLATSIFGNKGSTVPSDSSTPKNKSSSQVSAPTLSLNPGTKVQPQSYLVQNGLSLPSVMDFYEVKTNNVPMTAFTAKNLATKWGFKNEPQVSQTTDGNQYLFINDLTDRLLVKENPLTLSFVKNLDISSGLPELTVNQAQAERVALNFVNSLNLFFSQGFTVKLHDSYFLKSAGTYSQKVASIKDANQIGVNFGLYFSNHQIYTESSPRPLINIIVGGSGQISYAQIILPFGLGANNPTLNNQGQINLKDENTVKDEVKNGQAVIKYLKLMAGNGDEEVTDNPSFLTLSSFEIAYLATSSGDKNYLYPIYVFKAAGALPDGRDVEGTVYLQATK